GVPCRVERSTSHVRARLATGDVDRRDHDVESGEQVVLVIEVAVRADLQLAAVQEPDPPRLGTGGGAPGRLLRGEPRVQLRDDRALLLHAVRIEAVGDGEAL